MAESASNYFVGNLGPASSELEERIKQWAAGNCMEHRVSRDDGLSLRLLARRKQPTTTRNLRNLLRTLAKTRWGTPLGELSASWLRPLGEEEFRMAMGEESAALEDEAVAPTSCGDEVVLLQLSEGFDVRSQALLAELRAQRI